MKIAIIGASGKQGKLLVKEALKRGHDVTAIVRDSKKITEKVHIIEKDLFKLQYDDIKPFDIIINAFGTWAPETLIQHQTSLKHLCDILSKKPNRLLIVGGAGSLYLDKAHKLQLIDAPDFPEMFKPLAISENIAFIELLKRNDVKWTYLCPAADFQADGKRTGEYVTAGDELTVNSKGKSEISYADYAIAMIDEAENGKFIGKRFSVVSK